MTTWRSFAFQELKACTCQETSREEGSYQKARSPCQEGGHEGDGQGKEACRHKEEHHSYCQESCHSASTEEDRAKEDYRRCLSQETNNEIDSACQEGIDCENGTEEGGLMSLSIVNQPHIPFRSQPRLQLPRPPRSLHRKQSQLHRGLGRSVLVHIFSSYKSSHLRSARLLLSALYYIA